MVVDDERDAADTQALFLKYCGQTVEKAYDGPSALSLAAEFKPEILFVDLVMPMMDGVTLMRRLRKLPGMDKVRFVAVSALSQAAVRENALASGFDAYLVKPASASDFIGVLVDVAKKRGSYPPPDETVEKTVPAPGRRNTA